MCGFLLIILSCNQPHKKSLSTIVVNEEPQTNRISDLCDSVFFTPLETDKNFLLGDLTKIIMSDSVIWVFDEFNTQTIAKFNRQGNFLTAKLPTGTGPGEYLHPSDFAIDHNGDLLVYSTNAYAMIRYDSNGHFIRADRWGFFVDKFAPLRNGFLVCSPTFKDLLGIGRFNYTFFVMNHNKPDTSLCFLPYKESDFGFFYPGLINQTDSMISFVYGLENKIFAFDMYQFKVRYILNFGDRAIPPTLLDLPVAEAEEELRTNQYAGLPHKLTETTDWLAFSYYRGVREQACFFHKATGKTLNIKKITYDADSSRCRFPITTYRDFFISYAFPYELRGSFSDSAIRANKPLFNLLNSMKDEDNPILVGYRFKQ